jgi:acyl carrier protein
MTEQILKQIICTKFLNGDLEYPIDRHTRLLDEGIIDSLGLVQLVAEIEKWCPEFRIDDQDIIREHFGTMDAILALLDRRTLDSR